jgi:chromosome segregation protein
VVARIATRPRKKSVKRAVEEAHNALQARVAELRHVEAELETVRQGHMRPAHAARCAR